MPRRVWRATAAVLAVLAGPAAGDPWHRPAVISGEGPVRAALSRRDAKLDARLRGLLAPAPLPRALGFVPARGAWQRDGAVHVKVRLTDGAGTDALVARGLTVERRLDGVVEGWIP